MRHLSTVEHEVVDMCDLCLTTLAHPHVYSNER